MSDEDETPEVIMILPLRSLSALDEASGTESRPAFISDNDAGSITDRSSVVTNEERRYNGIIPSSIILNRIFERRTRRSRSEITFRPIFGSNSQFELNGYLTSELNSRYWALGAPLSTHSSLSERTDLESSSSTSIMVPPVHVEFNDGFSYVGGEQWTMANNPGVDMPDNENRSILGAAYERHMRSRTPPQYVPTRDFGTPRSAVLTLPATRQAVAGQFEVPPAEASTNRLPYPSDIAEALLHVEFVTRPWVEANPRPFSFNRKPRMRPRSDSC